MAELTLSVALSSFAVKSAAGDCPYVGVPAILSRAFRHTSIYVRKDRVARPQDLKGRQIGVAECDRLCGDVGRYASRCSAATAGRASEGLIPESPPDFRNVVAAGGS